MTVLSSVSCPPRSAAIFQFKSKSSLLPSFRRVVRSLSFRGAFILLLLLFSSAVLLTGQRGGRIDLSPVATAREMERTTDKGRDSRILPVFLKDVTPDPDGRNIYQIVTSSPDTLKGRHYCSLESFCKHNPGSVVWLLFLGQKILVGKPLRVLIQLEQNYSNLQVAQLELWTAIRDTPLQDIITSGKLSRSKYPANHLSDVLRLGVVYKAGGLYTDFDFICWRSVEDVRNTMALAVPNRLMNGLFHFEANHPFLNLLLEDATKNFDGSLWSHNGPLLFTRTAKIFCPQFKFLGNFSSRTKSFDISPLLMDLASIFTGKDRHKRGPSHPSSRLKSPISSSSSSNVIPNNGSSSLKAGSEVACGDVGLLGTSEFMPVSQTDIDSAFEENSTASFAETLGRLVACTSSTD